MTPIYTAYLAVPYEVSRFVEENGLQGEWDAAIDQACTGSVHTTGDRTAQVLYFVEFHSKREALQCESRMQEVVADFDRRMMQVETAQEAPPVEPRLG